MAKSALVVVGGGPFCLLASAARELTEGLRDLGIEAELATFPDAAISGPEAFERDWAEACRRLQAKVDEGGDFFLLDMNGHLKFTSVRRTGMKRFCFVVDPPWNHFDNLRTIADDATISYLDRNHAAFHTRFPTGKKTVFMPHGGPPADEEWHEDRPIDVLFLGNLAAPCRMEHFDALTAQLPEPVRLASRLAVELILDEGVEPFQALSAALAAHGLGVETLGARPFVDLLCFISMFVRQYNRMRMLCGLGKVPITVAGGVQTKLFGQPPPNLNFMGVVDEQAAMALMRRSRIVLNSMTIFSGGSHERIWYSMALGAAVACEPSSFVEETLSFGPHLLSLEDALASDGESLRQALADTPKGVLPQARAARDVYAANHTWRHRARIIQKAMA